MQTTQQTKFGIWITNREGEPNGRWMSDINHGVDKWYGDYDDAEYAAASRRGTYRHLNYEVKPMPQEVEP